MKAKHLSVVLAGAVALSCAVVGFWPVRDGDQALAATNPSYEPPDEFPPFSEAAAARAGVHGKEAILFWRGITNRSTASSLLLITVNNASTTTMQRTCVERGELIEALIIEKGVNRASVPYDELINFALAQPHQTFTFSRPGALKLVARKYDERVLGGAHQALDSLTDAELLAGFSRGGRLHQLYSRYDWPEFGAWYFAIGHVLLERGLLPGRDCVDGSLYVVR